MKKVMPLILTIMIVFSLVGCSSQTASTPTPTAATLTWQEQYDLGMKYLSESNYQEAIIAFTAAIELEPKKADLYMGLSDAYQGAGDIDNALQALQDGLLATGDAAFQAKIDELFFAADAPIVWQDSAFEAGVRAMLGMESGDICPSDLSKIYSLQIVGDKYFGKKEYTGNSLFELDKDEPCYSWGGQIYTTMGAVTSLQDIRNFQNLMRLEIICNPISSLQGLESAQNLDWLTMPGCNISDISALGNLPKLDFVMLRSNSITDISALENATALTYLDVENNSISNIDVVASFPLLDSLHISDNAITSLAPVSKLSNLVSLMAHRNQISDVSPLQGLNTLEYLGLDENAIHDISPLAGLTNLKSLGLGRNQISNITPLAGLSNLTYVSLYDQSITDWSPVAHVAKVGGRD